MLCVKRRLGHHLPLVTASAASSLPSFPKIIQLQSNVNANGNIIMESTDIELNHNWIKA